MQLHTIDPIIDSASRILILGSFPSVRSRDAGFYYAHRTNRFWQVLSAVLNVPLPLTVDAKRDMLLSHHIALFDVIYSCNIKGSSDNSISEAVPNDIRALIDNTAVTSVYTNGKTAHRYYQLMQREAVGIQDVCLPSTSAANAAYSLERLTSEWSVIRVPLEL